MKTAYKSLYSIILLIMLMLLMPFISFAADTIRVNIPRVTVTMARSYNFNSAANSVYVPVEFNSAMSADKVADYIEESNAFLFDHYGDDVVEKNSTGGISRTSTKYDFRGNILAVDESHSAGSLTITKGTTYSYDQRGRMLSERGIDYDLNGNIVTLQRFGSNASAVEDNLSYSYNGNRLTALTGSSQGVELNAAYSYDAGGNMLYDGRRGLGISYNMLNLPAKVVEKTGATAADGAVKAEYLYSADGIKQRVVDGAGSNGYLYLGTLVLSKSGESYSLASTGFGGGRIIGTANNSCLAYYYGTDHLGSVRVITDGSGSVVERNDYYPLGMRTATGNGYPQLATNHYKYNGKEVQTLGGIGFTDYGARMYDDFTGRWFVPDPLAEKYSSMSPYMYCGGNPINAIDVDGRSTWVVRAGKGKYEVVGGNLYDNDRNIYVGTLDKKNNKFTREYSIGITTSITSFYYCDAKEGPKWSEESIIDVNDRSGYEFLKKIMSQIPPMIDDYMLNARTGHRYDFKVTNGTDHEIEGIDIYRGMPVGVTDKGQVIFSSARDIGNITAGFIAGVNGMPWIPSRLAFDFYQGGIEGISTRNAEFYGWQLGYYNTSATQKRDNLMNSLGSAVMSLFKSFKNKKK